MDLFRRGDFVRQSNSAFCIPAAIVTMINVAEPGAPASASLQPGLYEVARKLSSWRLVGTGAEAAGWAGALTTYGYPYRVHVAGTSAEALRVAARAIRETRRPVGLIVWRGAHAWVMSGFRATADPAASSSFEVTHVYVQDPWYPRWSSMWGASFKPDSLVSKRALAAEFLPFRRPTVRYPDKDGRFVLVVPVATR